MCEHSYRVCVGGCAARRGRAVLVILLALLAGERSAAGADGPADSQPGLYSDAQALRGQRLYEEHCATCHGGRLEGSPGAPLAGAGFLARWADGQHTLDDLFYVTRTLMPYNAPGSLTRQQYADLTAYVLKANGYPAGEQELPPNPAALKQVTLQPR